MTRKCWTLPFVFIAVFLFCVCLRASALPWQEEAEQRSQQTQKEKMEKSQEREGETAEESQSPEITSVEESLAAEEASLQKTQPEEGEEVEPIVPAPKDIKEATAIYVFLGWMWLSILVLIYFLRLKVKETDRVHQLKFFVKDEE